jgi:hypothetical protein
MKIEPTLQIQYRVMGNTGDEVQELSTPFRLQSNPLPLLQLRRSSQKEGVD